LNPKVPMKRIILAVLALCLLVPATAAAKFSAARVCGPSDCRTVTLDDGQTLLRMEEPVILKRQRVSSASPQGPWYRITLCPGRCRSSEAVSVRVFPAARYAQIEHGGRFGLSDDSLSAYRTATRGLPPYEAASDGSGAPGGSSGVPAWAWGAIAAAALGVGALSVLLVRRVVRPHPSG
jgi:hypothetical protein